MYQNETGTKIEAYHCETQQFGTYQFETGTNIAGINLRRTTTKRIKIERFKIICINRRYNMIKDTKGTILDHLTPFSKTYLYTWVYCTSISTMYYIYNIGIILDISTICTIIGTFST